MDGQRKEGEVELTERNERGRIKLRKEREVDRDDGRWGQERAGERNEEAA